MLSGQSSGLSPKEDETHAKAILAVSVLSVVLSAPLGALFIALAGPRLLQKGSSKFSNFLLTFLKIQCDFYFILDINTDLLAKLFVPTVIFTGGQWKKLITV